mgnify:CR=1 FL=1
MTNDELDNRLIGINIAYYRKLKKYTQMQFSSKNKYQSKLYGKNREWFSDRLCIFTSIV